MWSDIFVNHIDSNFDALTKDIFMEEFVEKIFLESESIIDKNWF